MIVLLKPEIVPYLHTTMTVRTVLKYFVDKRIPQLKLDQHKPYIVHRAKKSANVFDEQMLIRLMREGFIL